MKKNIGILNERNPNNVRDKADTREDDLGFMLWKAELNKELLSFWKSITEQYQE